MATTTTSSAPWVPRMSKRVFRVARSSPSRTPVDWTVSPTAKAISATHASGRARWESGRADSDGPRMGYSLATRPGEVALAGVEDDALVAHRVAHDDRAARDARKRAPAAVGDEPACAAHGGVAVTPVGAEAPAMVAPPEAPARARARGRGGERGAVCVRAVAPTQIEVDVAAPVLAHLEATAAEMAGLGGAGRECGGEGDRAGAGIELGAQRQLGAQLERDKGRGARAAHQHVAAGRCDEDARAELGGGRAWCGGLRRLTTAGCLAARRGRERREGLVRAAGGAAVVGRDH